MSLMKGQKLVMMDLMDIGYFIRVLMRGKMLFRTRKIVSALLDYIMLPNKPSACNRTRKKLKKTWNLTSKTNLERMKMLIKIEDWSWTGSPHLTSLNCMATLVSWPISHMEILFLTSTNLVPMDCMIPLVPLKILTQPHDSITHIMLTSSINS